MKRIISYLLAIIMLISCFPEAAYAKSILVYQDFEGFDIGETLVSSKAFKTGGTAGTYFDVSYPPRSSGKVLKVSADTTTDDVSATSANCYLQIDKKGIVNIYADIMPTDISSMIKLGFKTTGDNKYPGTVCIRNNGTVVAYTGEDSTAVEKKAIPYDPNEWIKLKVTVNTGEGLFSCWANGINLAENLPVSGGKDFLKEYGIAQCIIQRGTGNNIKTTYYLDNVKVTCGDDDGELEAPIWNEESSGLQVRFHPRNLQSCQQNPPFFRWPALTMANGYEMKLSRNSDMSDPVYYIKKIERNFCMLDHTMEVGVWYWSVKGTNINGDAGWSQPRRFRIEADACEFPVPDTDTLRGMVRQDHPKIWVNSDTLAEYRALANGASKDFFEEIKARVDAKVDDPAPEEPVLTVPANATADEINVAKSELRADSDGKVNEMFEAGYMYILTGEQKYADKAVRFMDSIVDWDPNGFTSYATQDQVHRAIAYKTAITYDWVYSLLSPSLKERALSMIRVRTKTMFDELLKSYPLGEDPYNSHGWSAAEFMLIISLATMNEIPEATEWFNEIAPLIIGVYSVWGGEDGGYSNGTAYASFGNSMFLAVTEDAFYSATGFKMWERAYGRNEHKYFFYFSPNGAPFTAFGDEAYNSTNRDSTVINSHMATSVRFNNTAAKWATETRGCAPYNGEISYYHYFSDDIESIPPFDYITSYHDRDIGWVSMMSDLVDPWRKEVLFKSSFYGSYNHSHADQNSFIIAAYGEPLATDNGYYDYFGSEHDKKYAKTSLAHNVITYDGKGQYFYNANGEGNINSKGKIMNYLHGDVFNLASGDATEAYSEGLSKSVRHIIYLKPDVAIVVDDLKSKDNDAVEYGFNLHSLSAFEVDEDSQSAELIRGRAKLEAKMHYPEIANIQQFDKFIGTDGVEVRPGTRHAAKKNQFNIRFNTPKVSDTVMVTSLDILKAEETPKNISSEISGNCMKVNVNDEYSVYIKLNQDDASASFGDISFDGDAAAFKGDSYILVNGTFLEKSGRRLISAQSKGSFSYEGGEIHISSETDNSVSYSLGINVSNVKDDKGNEYFGEGQYDYATMPLKWSQNADKVLKVDFEAGSRNLYFNDTPVIKRTSDLTVRVNGTPVNYVHKPYSLYGTVYVPLEETAAAYKAEVSSAGNKYTIVKNDKTITVTPGVSNALYNGQTVDIAAAPVMKDGVLYIPFRGFFSIFTNRMGWSDLIKTAYVYTEPKYQDDMSSSVWPRTDTMSAEELAEYQKKKLISIFKSGKGTIENNNDEIFPGDKLTFTITPYDGYYVKSVKFNGNEAKGFETAGGIYISPPVTAGAELYVVFSRKPGIMETPYVFSHENEIFFFGRVYKNGGVKETGILISLNNPFPEEGNAETIKVPSVFPASSSGYFGFRLINSTGRESLICYIRPYAVYNNGNVAYGGVYRAETEAMKQIENFDTLEKRLEEMGFSETGIVRYVIGAEEESKDSVSEDTQLPNFD